MINQQLSPVKNKKTAIFIVVGVLLLLGLGIGSKCLISQASMPLIYHAPQAIKINLDPVWSESNSEVIKMRATIKSLIGTASAVKVSFYSSSDLMIDKPTEFSLGSINQGEVKNLEISVRESGKGIESSTQEISAWDHEVEMGVSYYPDYEQIMQAIKNNLDEYSSENERNDLLRVIMKDQETKESRVEGIAENFFREDKFPFKDIRLKDPTFFAPAEENKTSAVFVVAGVLLFTGLSIGGFFLFSKIKSSKI